MQARYRAALVVLLLTWGCARADDAVPVIPPPTPAPEAAVNVPEPDAGPPDEISSIDASDEPTSTESQLDAALEAEAEAAADADSCPGWVPPDPPRNCSKSGANGECTTTCSKGTDSWRAECVGSTCSCKMDGVSYCTCVNMSATCGSCCPGMP